MPELDALKEELAYLRLWLGMLAVTDISLTGWTASAIDTASTRLLSLSVAVMIVLGTGVLLLNRLIERRIERIRRLRAWISSSES
jgi:hypothetical protein